MADDGKKGANGSRDKKREARERSKQWRLDNLEYARKRDLVRHYKRRYGIDGQYVPKRGICSICGKTRRLCVEHCHKEGHIRGFVCTHCNVWLGQYENPVFMERIKKHLLSKIEVDAEGKPINVPEVRK